MDPMPKAPSRPLRCLTDEASGVWTPVGFARPSGSRLVCIAELPYIVPSSTQIQDARPVSLHFRVPPPDSGACEHRTLYELVCISESPLPSGEGVRGRGHNPPLIATGPGAGLLPERKAPPQSSGQLPRKGGARLDVNARRTTTPLQQPTPALRAFILSSSPPERARALLPETLPPGHIPSGQFSLQEGASTESGRTGLAPAELLPDEALFPK